MGGGRSKFFAQEALSSGEAYFDHTTAGRMVMQPTRIFRSVVRILVGSFRSAVRILIGGLLAAASPAVFTRPGFEAPTKKTVVSCTTIGPLLDQVRNVPPLLGAACATDKKPKLCVSVSLTAGLAKRLIG